MTDLITIPAQELIHLPSLGDQEKCKEYLEILDHVLSKKIDEGDIRGYDILTIKNVDDITLHFIETNYSSVTNDKFPFLYAFIQPLSNYEELLELTKSLHMVEPSGF